tara:strand:+ start:2191 stop:2388 length:198 start_codon:yes stop_codon:yes gene_type:complete
MKYDELREIYIKYKGTLIQVLVEDYYRLRSENSQLKTFLVKMNESIDQVLEQAKKEIKGYDDGNV